MASSMTGFGAAEAVVGGRTLRIEVRSVNHRFFNFSARLPGDLAPFESEARDQVRKTLERGHVTLSLRWLDDGVGEDTDWATLQAAADSLRAMRDRLGLEGEITLDLLLRHSDLAGTRRELTGAAPADWAAIVPLIQQAVDACRAARDREGAILTQALLQQIGALEAGAGRVALRAPDRIRHEMTRLRAHLAQLLEGHALPEERIAQEIALVADRFDISEELVRLAAHCEAVRGALAGTAPVGKQLGFLAQELGREVNTIGSKANDATIAHEVVAMKGELEKFREQLENLE